MPTEAPFEVENALAAPGAAPGGDYNLLPYPSLPFSYTQPSHLAALASLYGLDVPAADRARVLELGCASGGNIIPLAVRFPAARFLGIDLSQRQVDDGRRRIEQLGLANVEVRQGDLAQIDLSGQVFDYVICHGVFSWVPRTVQDRILQVSAAALEPNGLAVISYNVLPGWHLRSVVRDICLHHVGSSGSPRDRVTSARRLLKQIAEGVSDAEPYGLLLRREADRVARLPASYILGEFLAQDNHPLHFHEFAARAGGHGLSYLCEGDLASSVSESLFPDTQKAMRSLAGGDPLSLEQYKDFFSGRPFRRSVLTKAREAGAAAAGPDFTRLSSLHLAGHFRFDPVASSADVSVYQDAQGRGIRAKDLGVRRALERLGEAYPATRTVPQLIDAGAGAPADGAAMDRVCRALFTLAAAGQATISTLPLRVGHADTERPKVWALARIEAAAGQPWVTNLRHDAVALEPLAAKLLPCLDGTRDRHGLAAHVAATSGTPSEDTSVERVLRFIAGNALIEPA